jgi:hypothetical protein
MATPDSAYISNINPENATLQFQQGDNVLNPDCSSTPLKAKLVYPQAATLSDDASHPLVTAKATLEAGKLKPLTSTKLDTGVSVLAYSKTELSAIKASIKCLEKQTNLNTLPYFIGGELARIKHQFTDLNINKYYVLLCFLVYGFDSSTLSAHISKDSAEFVVDEQFLREFQRMALIPQLKDILKKTPAYQSGCFEDIGQFGNMAANADRMENNVITGPTTYAPSLVTNALEAMHPGSVAGLEKFCNKIRSRAYLSMPKGSFGSIQKVTRRINKVIKGFNKLMNDFYKGIASYIRKAYAWINGKLNELQKKLMSFIEDIIPLDLLCLLLDTMQVILDDLNFFTSLFNMTGSIINVLNTIQNYVNFTSNLVQNPFNTLKQFLPKDVLAVVNSVQELGTDPEGWMSDQLANYGLSYIATALQGDIVGALMQKYGKNNYGMSGPLADAMSKAAAIWNRYSADGSKLPSSFSGATAPNLFKGGTENVFGESTVPTDLLTTLKSDFISLSSDISQLPSDVGGAVSSGLNAAGSGISKFASSINPFKSSALTAAEQAAALPAQ